MSEKKSVLEQIRALKEQEARLLDGAKSEAMDKAHKAIAELKELGFDFRIVEGAESGKKVFRATAAKRQQKDAPCPICKFKTDPLHDGRAHRSQSPKKPFTATELSARGFKKID